MLLKIVTQCLLQVSAPLPIKLLDNAQSGKATGDSTSIWIPATNLGDPDGVPISWLQPDPFLDVVAI